MFPHKCQNKINILKVCHLSFKKKICHNLTSLRRMTRPQSSLIDYYANISQKKTPNRTKLHTMYLCKSLIAIYLC